MTLRITLFFPQCRSSSYCAQGLFVIEALR